MEEKQFKNYKEKQRYYAQKAKEESIVWESGKSHKNNNSLIKGRTYVKPKESEKNVRTNSN